MEKESDVVDAVRKSSRNTRLKSKALLERANAKKDPVQTKSRRNKKMPLRTPYTSSNTCTTAVSLFYRGRYFQVGDIVSLMDDSGDGDLFYAQIRGLMQDSFCEKSAVITWLLPTIASPDPNSGFDAATYTIGPEEDLPRKLSAMSFVMHAPSSYYHDQTNPYPAPEILQKDNHLGYCGFIWTNLATMRS